MTRLPKKVLIGGVTYKVVDDDDDTLHRDAVVAGARRGLYGITDMKEPTIYLHSENHVSRQREVLLHEVMHGINDFTGVVHLLGREKEEDVCQRTAPALLAVLRSNARLVQYTMDGVL